MLLIRANFGFIFQEFNVDMVKSTTRPNQCRTSFAIVWATNQSDYFFLYLVSVVGQIPNNCFCKIVLTICMIYATIKNSDNRHKFQNLPGGDLYFSTFKLSLKHVKQIFNAMIAL